MKLFIKLLILWSCVVIATASTISERTYCDGWEDGYCEGWRDIKGEFAICPVTPVCPIPEVNKTRYQDGYNRGFKAGYKKAKQ